MSHARNLVYSFVKQQVQSGDGIEAGSFEDDYLHGLLNRVQDDQRHRDAEQLRAKAEQLLDMYAGKRGEVYAVHCHAAEVLNEQADAMDPYVRLERGGQLVRKSNGAPVIL